MTRDDNIINMAVQAGISEAIWFYDYDVLEKFAALVAAAEREACAKVCEADSLLWGQKYAAAIRARNTQEQPR